jgi:hypothetical protein
MPSKTPRAAAESAPNSAGAGSPVENSPYPGAKVFPSRVPSTCSSLTSSAPLMFPLGPATFSSTFSTRTSLNTTSGTFSGRYTSPGCGSAGMIIAAGVLSSTSQVPEVSATLPSSKAEKSSPKYHTEPSSAWA